MEHTLSMLNKTVLVTGGTGFLGSVLCRKLANMGAEVICGGLNNVTTNDDCISVKCDLTNPNEIHSQIFGRYNIDYVFHCAGYNGGISFNERHPWEIFYRNTVMGLHLIEAANRCHVKKMVSVVTSCAYEDGCPVLFPHQILSGQPHPSVACHGYAKRNLQLGSKYARQEHFFSAMTACLTTLYGPGDSTDLTRTKVMMALIKKFVDARNHGDRKVVLLGNGRPKRQFIYIDDAADFLIHAFVSSTNFDTPVQIATEDDLSVAELATLISSIVGFAGEIEFSGESSGQHAKKLVSPYYNHKHTSLEDGIRKTVAWYESRYTHRIVGSEPAFGGFVSDR